MPTDKLIEELQELISEGSKKPVNIARQMEANLAKHWENPGEHNAAKAARDLKVKPSKLVKASKSKPPVLSSSGSNLTEAEDKTLKALAKHKTAFGSHYDNFVGDDPIYELSDIASVRSVKGGAVKVSFKGDDPVWYYKGHEIQQDTDVPKGYSGRWKTGGYRHGKSSGSLEGLLAQLD